MAVEESVYLAKLAELENFLQFANQNLALLGCRRRNRAKSKESDSDPFW